MLPSSCLDVGSILPFGIVNVLRLTWYVFFFLVVTLSKFSFHRKRKLYRNVFSMSVVCTYVVNILFCHIFLSFFYSFPVYFNYWYSYALRGNSSKKTFEIKNLRLRGGATEWLRYSFSLMSLFTWLKSNQKVKAVNLSTKNVFIPLKILQTLRAKIFLTLHSTIFLTCEF